MSELDHAVFKTPIETLVNLWVAKFGADWVHKSDVADDPYFQWVAMRLRSIGKLEEHQINEPGQPAPQAGHVLGSMPPRKITVLRIVTEGS